MRDLSLVNINRKEAIEALEKAKAIEENEIVLKHLETIRKEKEQV